MMRIRWMWYKFPLSSWNLLNLTLKGQRGLVIWKCLIEFDQLIALVNCYDSLVRLKVTNTKHIQQNWHQVLPLLKTNFWCRFRHFFNVQPFSLQQLTAQNTFCCNFSTDNILMIIFIPGKQLPSSFYINCITSMIVLISAAGTDSFFIRLMTKSLFDCVKYQVKIIITSEATKIMFFTVTENYTRIYEYMCNIRFLTFWS